MTNLFRNKSTNFYENCTPSSMAHHTKLRKNLTKRPIYFYTVAMIFIILRSLRRICIEILCYYYFQIYREGDN